MLRGLFAFSLFLTLTLCVAHAWAAYTDSPQQDNWPQFFDTSVVTCEDQLAANGKQIIWLSTQQQDLRERAGEYTDARAHHQLICRLEQWENDRADIIGLRDPIAYQEIVSAHRAAMELQIRYLVSQRQWLLSQLREPTDEAATKAVVARKDYCIAKFLCDTVNYALLKVQEFELLDSESMRGTPVALYNDLSDQVLRLEEELS